MQTLGKNAREYEAALLKQVGVGVGGCERERGSEREGEVYYL